MVTKTIPVREEKRSALLATGVCESVLDFASQLGMLEHLGTAFRIAQAQFPTAQGWAFRAYQEPAQIEIHVMVQGSVEEVYRRHSACVDLWIKHLPPEALGRMALTVDFA
jgi:hypothetical protein